MPSRLNSGRDQDERFNLLRIAAGALQPPDLHRTDSLPRYTPWGAVILARLVTYVAWAISVALVVLVIGVTAVAVTFITSCSAGESSSGSVNLPQLLGDTLERDSTAVERRQLFGVHLLKLAGQRTNTTCPPFDHEGSSSRRRAYPDDPPVVLVWLARYQPACLERLHKSRHSRRAHLFCGGELAKRHRPREYDNRQCRESWTAQSRLSVLVP
jgi:hypothetical protein